MVTRNKGKFIKGQPSLRKGLKPPTIYGRIPWNKSKHYKLKNSGQFKKGERRSPNTEFSKEKTGGDKNVNWKGGVSKEYITLRQSLKYRRWRKSVFERDNYTCVKCNQKGGTIHADYIKEWAKYPRLRFDINNGQTLCLFCHKSKHGFRFGR